MSELPENIRHVLVKLVPASVVSNIACFVFYDDHPRDAINIDVIVCTKLGEVKEYYQRDLVSSIKLECITEPSEIRILRNKNCDLFYLVAATNEITILSRKNKLTVHQTISSVDKYDINDTSCNGQACLRVFRKGDAVPLIFDDNFLNFHCLDMSMTFTEAQNDESLPIITHLMRKFTEAKYSVKCNEKMYKEFLDIHQTAAFSTYKNIHPNLNDCVIKEGSIAMASTLRINMQTPWIKVCNKKVLIVLNVCNMNHEPLEDVHILLHCANLHSVEYTTKLFEKTDSSPFWKESQSQILKHNVDSAVIVVINLDELKNNVLSKIEFNGVLFYRRMRKECLLPIEDVKLSSLDTMGEEFDAISSDEMDKNAILSILATTEKTDLVMRHINSPNDHTFTLNIFCKYLQMEMIPNCDNTVIHRKSPYHVLNGVMVILCGEVENGNDSFNVSVYTRTESQVLALIHYIHDAIPLKIVITTPDQKIIAKDNKLSKYNEEVSDDTQVLFDYNNYAASVLNRTSLILKYLDDSMIKMSESKDMAVLKKIGSEIDLFAGTENDFMDFKKKMRVEAASGAKSSSDLQLVTNDDAMCID